MSKTISQKRVRQILTAAQQTRVLVVGDVMLDQFIWGSVSRISPEAPVPVLDFSRESFMPGGAANVARNLVSLATPAELFGAIGHDDAARKLLKLLGEQGIGCDGLVKNAERHTSVKTRIVAHQQQVVRVDRETRGSLDEKTTARLLAEFRNKMGRADAVIVGEIGGGAVRGLRQSGIAVYQSPAQTVAEAVAQFNAGELPELDAQHACSGHAVGGDCHH